MARSNDLDTIAPDDPIIEVSKNPPTSGEKENTPPVKEETISPIMMENDEDNEVRSILGHTTGPLSATLVFPNYFNFSEKSDNEVIYTALRPHWFTNVPWIFLTIIMLLAPIIIKTVPIKPILSSNIFSLILIFWYLVTFTFSLEKFISWYFNIFIITNMRVIDIDVHNLLDRKFAEAQICMIQDLSYKVSGVSQTFLNYGSIKIETAGESPDITFEKIAAPGKVMKLLQGLCQNVTPNK